MENILYYGYYAKEYGYSQPDFFCAARKATVRSVGGNAMSRSPSARRLLAAAGFVDRDRAVPLHSPNSPSPPFALDICNVRDYPPLPHPPLLSNPIKGEKETGEFRAGRRSALPLDKRSLSP